MKEKDEKKSIEEKMSKLIEENKALKQKLDKFQWKTRLKDHTETSYQALLLLSQIKEELSVISHNLSEYFKSQAEETDEDEEDDEPEEPDEDE